MENRAALFRADMPIVGSDRRPRCLVTGGLASVTWTAELGSNPGSRRIWASFSGSANRGLAVMYRRADVSFPAKKEPWRIAPPADHLCASRTERVSPPWHHRDHPRAVRNNANADRMDQGTESWSFVMKIRLSARLQPATPCRQGRPRARRYGQRRDQTSHSAHGRRHDIRTREDATRRRS